MKIIIAGCGKVGSTITAQLAMEGHDIAVIDVNSDVIDDITNNYDVMGVVGNAASYTLLKEAGAEEADLLIAATDSDELNLLSCLIARKAGGCGTIARVRNPVYNSEMSLISGDLGLTMAVNPEYAAACEAARVIRIPSAIKVETFIKGRVELMKFVIPEESILDGMRLADLAGRVNTEVLVCTVERGDQVVIPGGQFTLAAGDIISIVASKDNGTKFFKATGLEGKSVRNVIIVGGGTVGYYLAKQLLDLGMRVKIIERDHDRCEQLADLLPNAITINADATSKEILLEQKINTCDAFVTLTGIDEENLFLSLFARHCGNAKIVTKVNRMSFDEVLRDFEFGSIINPKNITADYILQYVRARQNSMGSNVETLYNIIEGRVEALEFVIHEGAPVVGIPLAQLPTKDNVLIACIGRKGQIIIPNGRAVIEPGDRVVVVTSHLGFQDIKDILEDR